MKKRTGLFLLAAFALVGCSSYGNEISAEEFAVRKQNIQNEDADVADLNGYTYTLELKDPTENFYSKVEAKYVKSTNDLMLKTFVKSNDTCEGAAIYSVTKGDTYTFVTASLDEKENVDKGTYFQIKSPLVSTIASHISDIKNTINSYVGSLKSDYVSIEKLDQAIENPQLFFEFENNNFETSIKYYSKNQKSLAVVYSASATNEQNQLCEFETIWAWENGYPIEASQKSIIDGNLTYEMSIKLSLKTPSIKLPDLSKLDKETSL